MRLIFAGTPEFAACALRSLVMAGHQIVLVLTQPDKPAGRGMILHESPVKVAAKAFGIEVYQPASLRDPAVQDRLSQLEAEAMVVAAYGLILPQAVLDQPRYGCINIHASLLPRWRGAAPIQRALLAGDAETGVCIMQMEAGLDTGPVLHSAALSISSDETAASLHDKLAELGAGLIVETLARLPLSASPQAEDGATYAAKIEKAEALLDWCLPATVLERKVRAFNPFPGALISLNGVKIKVWKALAEPMTGQPGCVLSADRHGVVVACEEGALRLVELQKAGGKRLAVGEFLAGNAIKPGVQFDPAA